MRSCILILASFFLIGSIYSQTIPVSDSLLVETCKTIKKNKQPIDSSKIYEAFELHLAHVFENLDDSSFKKTYTYIYVRLQKLCPEFKQFLDENQPPQGDWIPMETKPDSKLDKKSCREFLNHKSYYYIEQSGDTVQLSLSGNFWIDSFTDGTYSKLKLYWISDTEFEVSFIESTNLIKKNLSKPGEKYKYELLEKFPTYYLVCLNMPDLNILGTFRIYYQ